MRDADQILWALDNSISPDEFERLCIDLLGRDGYRHIVPVGGEKDHGRDAELRYHLGASEHYATIAFQFSLDKRWEQKLSKDSATIAAHRPDVVAMVFVTSSKVSGAKQDSLQSKIRSRYGWDLRIYSREWLRQRLSELHHDLAAKYLGITLPPTPGFAATQFEFADLDDYGTEDIFRHTSPELLRATIAGRTDKEPHEAAHWYQLARVEYLLRNHNGASRAVARALELGSSDKLLVLNIRLFHAALLAEQGIEQHSRPLLLRARDILLEALPERKRAVDHYNLGNILGALGETANARKEYVRSLVMEPGNAKAWKNLGSLFAAEGNHEAAMEAFDQALACQPALVEAHLCKATAYLIFREDPIEAIRCFELAFSLATSIHQKWPYVGYWFGRALSAVDRHEDALKQIDDELSIRSDNVWLLDQKAVVLTQLGRHDAAYEDKALDFLRFRAEAIPNDFFGLGEIIDILQRRGQPDAAWPLIDRNLRCEPFRLSHLASASGISVSDLRIGFRYARLYATFRAKFSTEDHCVSLHSMGLSPSVELIPALEYILMAVFGVAANQLNGEGAVRSDEKLNAVALTTLRANASVFPLIGSKWLAPSPPDDRAEQKRLLALGAFYLTDIIAAETVRQVAFLKGSFQIPGTDIFPTEKPRWGEIAADVSIQLMQQVITDWHLPAEDSAECDSDS